MRFRLAPRSMTLDDLELSKVRIFSEFRVISQIWEATTAKRMKIDRYTVSDRIVSPHCIFQRCIDYVDIAGRSSARGLQSEYKMAIFNLYTRKYIANGK